MSATEPQTREDPLIAALPPVTDYITYLTLLEYQLTPHNLGTLNHLLSADDGTLATEIGWDLLKLVLPMLHKAPIEVRNCLEIVARRGNPREVVVRVAEELEKLGLDGDDHSTYEYSEGEEDDALPTFAGEATRIHLGKMKLDGMPESEEHNLGSQSEEQPTEPQDESLVLQALLSMLGILHPRIKTQYPSRFLATSLPASLGAYRRLTINTASTTAFLALLGKLSGKRRPNLPPRTPSSIRDPSSTAPLPDPEAASEAEHGVKTPSETETTIINRLLQAVLLELLDDYVSSLQSEDVSFMSWTTRLRERIEPQRSIPGKITECEFWQSSSDLEDRDRLLEMMLVQAKELMLDAQQELEILVNSVDDPAATSSIEAEEEPSEYPTSPSQIPFPPSGLVLLVAAEAFYTQTQVRPTLSSDALQFMVALLHPMSLPSPFLKDATVSLIYPKIDVLTKLTSGLFQRLLNLLVHTFINTPEPQIRDNAHYISTKLLHGCPHPETRLQLIESAITYTDQSSSASLETDSATFYIAPHLQPALQAIGVDWLKDEFLAFIQTRQSISQKTSLTGSTSAIGLDPQILETNTTLQSALFGQTLSAPPEDSSMVLLTLPFHISVLNLLCILLSQKSKTGTDDKPTSTPTNTKPEDAETRPTSYLPTSLIPSAQTYLTTLESWREYLIPKLLATSNINSKAATNTTTTTKHNTLSEDSQPVRAQDDNDNNKQPDLSSGDDEDQEGIQAAGSDIFALDDACRRVRTLLA